MLVWIHSHAMDVWMAQDLPGPCQLGEVCLYATWEDNNRKLQCRGVVQFHCREETGFNTEPIISLQLQSDFLFCVVDRGQTETNACVWSSTGAGAVDATSPPQGWRRDGGREGGVGRSSRGSSTQLTDYSNHQITKADLPGRRLDVHYSASCWLLPTDQPVVLREWSSPGWGVWA